MIHGHVDVFASGMHIGDNVFAPVIYQICVGEENFPLLSYTPSGGINPNTSCVTFAIMHTHGWTLFLLDVPPM
jgi:hypothetical protein